MVVVTSNPDGHGNEDVAIEISMFRLIFEIRICEFFLCFVGGLVGGYRSPSPGNATGSDQTNRTAAAWSWSSPHLPKANGKSRKSFKTVKKPLRINALV